MWFLTFESQGQLDLMCVTAPERELWAAKTTDVHLFIMWAIVTCFDCFLSPICICSMMEWKAVWTIRVSSLTSFHSTGLGVSSDTLLHVPIYYDQQDPSWQHWLDVWYRLNGGLFNCTRLFLHKDYHNLCARISACWRQWNCGPDCL